MLEFVFIGVGGVDNSNNIFYLHEMKENQVNKFFVTIGPIIAHEFQTHTCLVALDHARGGHITSYPLIIL
jgi:hypothetical protein